jgi:hypothetical protein
VNFGSCEFPQIFKRRACGNKLLEKFLMKRATSANSTPEAYAMCRNLKVDLVNGGIKKARVSQGNKEYDIESISADAGEAQQVSSVSVSDS